MPDLAVMSRKTGKCGDSCATPNSARPRRQRNGSGHRAGRRAHVVGYMPWRKGPSCGRGGLIPVAPAYPKLTPTQKNDANAEGPRGIGVARIQLSDFVSEVELQAK